MHQCDPRLSCTDQRAMKSPGVGRWQSMLGHVPRQGGPCRAGGLSSGNAVSAASWWAGKGSDSSVLRLSGILRPQFNILSCSEPGLSELYALRLHPHVTDGETEVLSRRDLLITRVPVGIRGSGKSKSSHPPLQDLARAWAGPGRAGASRELTGHTAAFPSSCALQGEGLYLQRVHRLLPPLLPAPGVLHGQ